MKMLKIAATLLAACMASSLMANLENVSNGPIVPGEWNSNYDAGKEYADANHIPLVLFWASSGCGQCKALEGACNKPDFVAWRQTRQFVMIFVENDQRIYRIARSNGQYPTCLAYWLKEDGTVISKTFCGRTSSMTAAGSTQGEKFMNTLDGIFATQGQPVTASGTPTSTGSSASVGSEWNHSRALKAGLYNQATGRLGGYVLMKLGRANKNSKKSRVTPKLTLLDGKGRNFAPVTVSVDATTAIQSVNKYGTINATVTGESLGGTFTDPTGVVYDVRDVKLGGSIENGTYVFKMDDYPEQCNGMPVITKYLPLNAEFTSSASKLRTSGSSSLRFSVASNEFVPSNTSNPSALKLSYRSATGFIRGSVKIYALKDLHSARGYTATVTGFMVGNEGTAIVTLKGVGTFNCTISKK